MVSRMEGSSPGVLCAKPSKSESNSSLMAEAVRIARMEIMISICKERGRTYSQTQAGSQSIRRT